MAVSPEGGPFARPLPARRGRYLVQSARLVRLLDLCDRVLALAPRRSAPMPPRPTRILLANWAHLGDVVISFGVVAALRARFPGVFIGMVVGRWGRPAIADAVLVDQLHTVDHVLLDRGPSTRLQRWRRYLATRRRALREIRAEGYQVAIDLNPYFPPAHPLFYAAGIPTRIGFDSGGFAGLLTERVAWPGTNRPMAEQFAGLLQALDPAWPIDAAALRPRRARGAVAPLPEAAAAALPYVVLHPGAGAAFKDWGAARWATLAAGLRAEAGGFGLVVTGAGAHEAAVAAGLQAGCPAIVNLAGALGWESFASVLAHAALIICPDTAAGHVGALFDVPTIALFTGTNNRGQWSPYGDRAQALTHPVACAPCYRAAGCAAMACLRLVTPAQVLAAALAALAGARPE